MIILDRRMTLREVKIEIYKFFRPLFKNNDFKSIPENKKFLLSQEKLIEEEYKLLFESKVTPPYEIEILNNLPYEEGFFSKDHPQCEFC